MRRCEVRILDGEGHGLMAVPGVMGDILTEVAKEWEDWAVVTQGKRERRRVLGNGHNGNGNGNSTGEIGGRERGGSGGIGGRH